MNELLKRHPFGICAPWAEILCPYCYSGMTSTAYVRRSYLSVPVFGPLQTLSQADVLSRGMSDMNLCRCNSCDRQVWIEYDIAFTQRLANHFNGYRTRNRDIVGYLVQLGDAYNPAARIEREGSDFYLLVEVEHGLYPTSDSFPYPSYYTVYAYSNNTSLGWVEVYSGHSYVVACSSILRSLESKTWFDIPVADPEVRGRFNSFAGRVS